MILILSKTAFDFYCQHFRWQLTNEKCDPKKIRFIFSNVQQVLGFACENQNTILMNLRSEKLK